MEISRPGLVLDPSLPVEVQTRLYDQKKEEEAARVQHIGEMARAGDPALSGYDFQFYAEKVSQVGARSLRERWEEMKEKREVRELIEETTAPLGDGEGFPELQARTNRLLAAILKKLHTEPR